MTKFKEIAVIMCVYSKDDAGFFLEAVESVLNQSEILDLYIYIDGWVSSEIKSLIDKYKKREDVFVLSNDQSMGLAIGLNNLIDVVIKNRYEFIARMDSDDISLPDRFSEQMYFLKENQCIDVCGTFCSEFGSPYALPVKKLPTKHEQLVDFSIVRCPFIHPTVMFRRRVFENPNIRYPINTNFTEDMSLWFELLKKGYRFANIDKVLLKYRLSESTLVRRKGFKKAISEMDIRFKNMVYLKKVSLKNITLLTLRFILHISPVSIIRTAYKRVR
ncbi:glycosyltransferase [Citrobacter freundii]|nr:glycosyltransferase [Citrobacter freundii]QLY54439.1 glycosyltransferase [Citrobacter freundii]